MSSHEESRRLVGVPDDSFESNVALHDPLSYQFEVDAEQFKQSDPLATGVCNAFISFIRKDPQHALWLHQMRGERLSTRPFSPGHATRLNRYLLQDIILERNGYDMLPEFPDAETCSDLLCEVYQNDELKIDYEINHSFYDPITCKPGRYYGALLARHALRGVQDSFTHIDFGCGNNTGIATEHIATNDGYSPLRDILPKQPTIAQGKRAENDAFQRLLRASKQTPLQTGWGVDIHHPWEPYVNRFGIACNPSRLLIDPHYFEMRQLLIAHRESSPDIRFVWSDMSKSDTAQTNPEPHVGQYRVESNRRLEHYQVDPAPDKQTDIATAFYSLYMHSPEKKRDIFTAMADRAEIIVVFDAIEDIRKSRSKNPIDQLQFADIWKSYSSALVAYDQRDPKKGWQLIARSRDGDFAEIRPGALLKQSLRQAA